MSYSTILIPCILICNCFKIMLLFFIPPIELLISFKHSDLMLVSSGTAEYTLVKEDVGCRLEFVYIPINFEGILIFIFLWQNMFLILYHL